MITKLDHVTIVVRDVAAAVASYQRLLGAAPVWRGSHPEVGTSAALFALQNSLIELMGPSLERPDAEETEALRAHLSTQGEGLQTLSFGSEDAAACTRLLRERGVRATPPQEGQAEGEDGRVRSYRLVELSPRATRALPISIVERSEPVGVVPALAPALDHVVILSADLEQAIVLYRDQLGLRLALDQSAHGQRALFFRVGGVTVEVVQDDAQREADVLGGLCYRVADLDVAHARMQGEGLAVSECRAGRKPLTQVFTVRDGTHGVPTLILRDPSRDPRPE